MQNELFTIGPLHIRMYGVMIGAGYLAALIMSIYRGKKRNLDNDAIWDIFFCAIVGGMVGTKLLYYLTILPEIIKRPSLLWENFASGHVVYGGIIGGVLLSYLYCRWKRHNFLPYFDLVMPAVALAQAIGRIGCFFAGCCYGRETDAWYGIVYHTSEQAPNGVKLIPTQLISSGADLILCGILLVYARKERTDGRVAALYMILYGVGRFCLEFLRNDYRGSVGFLSTSQFISIGVVAAGIALYALAPRLFGRPRAK